MPQAKKWHLSKLRVKVNFVSSIQHLDRKKNLIASENGCAIEIISYYAEALILHMMCVCVVFYLRNKFEMNFVCFHFLGRLSYKAFSHDVTAAILMFQNIEMAANKSVNQFISVNTWDGAAPIIRAGCSWMKRRCMTIKIVNDSKPFQ